MGITRAVVRQAEARVAGGDRRHQAAHLSGDDRAGQAGAWPKHAPECSAAIRTSRARWSACSSRTREIIRKGKLAKPTEFGRLVKIQEAEAQFITDYEVCERGQAERALWAPALDRHIALFDHAPQLAVADGGFASRDAMSARRRTAGSGTSCCRASRAKTRSRRRARRSAGAQAVKDASAHSNVVTACGGVDTEARAGCSGGSGSASSPMICSCSPARGHDASSARARGDRRWMERRGRKRAVWPWPEPRSGTRARCQCPFPHRKVASRGTPRGAVARGRCSGSRCRGAAQAPARPRTGTCRGRRRSWSRRAARCPSCRTGWRRTAAS